jgi:16S rRNA processing protein RimM
MNKSTAINIGKIVATHGIKGWVVIKSYSYPTHNIKNYDTFLYIKNRKEFIEIVNLKIMPKKIIIRMKDYDDINSSEPLVGQDLFIEASDIPALKKGEYYWKDLEGLEVYTSRNSYIGSVDFIFNNGANDILAVKHNKELVYIPYVIDHIKVIPNEKIIIDHETI